MEQQDDNTLTPVLRQAVDVLKMVLFKALKVRLTERHTDAAPAHTTQLAGATLNALFGIPAIPLPPPTGITCGPDPTVDAIGCISYPSC